jgi:hypothetical protein
MTWKQKKKKNSKIYLNKLTLKALLLGLFLKSKNLLKKALKMNFLTKKIKKKQEAGGEEIKKTKKLLDLMKKKSKKLTPLLKKHFKRETRKKHPKRISIPKSG